MKPITTKEIARPESMPGSSQWYRGAGCAIGGRWQAEEGCSRPVRLICVALMSPVFLIVISSLLLLVFVTEGQSHLRRVAFFLLGLGSLSYYVQFLKRLTGRRKGANSRDEAGQGKNKDLLP